MTKMSSLIPVGRGVSVTLGHVVCWCWCILGVSIPCTASKTNVALNKPCGGSTSEPSRAINGVTNNRDCAFLSGSGSYSGHLWWTVDLENEYVIQSVRIYKRLNAYMHYEFEKFYLFVSDLNPFPDLVFTKGEPFPGTRCAYRDAPIASSVWNEFPCETKNLSGRFVTLLIPGFQGYVYLCQLEVMADGHPLGLPPNFDNAAIAVQITDGKRSQDVPYHTRVLDRPYQPLCVLECLAAKSHYFGGRSIVSQLNRETRECRCVLIGSFNDQNYRFGFLHDASWSTTEFDTTSYYY